MGLPDLARFIRLLGSIFMADVDDESMGQSLDQRYIAPTTQDQAFCAVMSGLAAVAQPPIQAASGRQQGQER
jgi:hypothetical protein